MSEKTKVCSICRKSIDREDAPVLTMGHFGNPRLLCPDCEVLIDTALKSKNAQSAEEAMAKLGETVGDKSVDDDAVIEAVEEIFKTATERAQAIKDGTYDFALDDSDSSDGFDEIPEELLETEEDKALDRRDEERAKRFDKIFNWITAFVLIAAAVLIVYNLVERFAT